MGSILFNPKGHLVTPPPLPRMAHQECPAPSSGWATHMLRVREVLSQPLSNALTHSLTLFLFTFACILGCWLCSCYRMKALVWRRPLWLHLAIPSFLFGFMLEGSCPSWGHPAGVGWLTRAPPLVTVKWFMEERHNPISCKLCWILKP